MSKRLNLKVGRLTDRGRRRRSNEDWLGFFETPDPRQRETKGAIFVVADGMDGRRPGHIASRLAVRMVIYEYFRDSSPQTMRSLERAIKLANARIYRQASQAYGEMVTTLVASIVQDNRLIVANVGDSRAYLIRRGGIWRLTRDHTWVAEEVARGTLTPAEARRHPWRKVITRALGRRPNVNVDMFRLRIQPGDSLLLCSDGLSDMVWDREILNIVARNNPQKAARKLVKLANRRGGRDNITAIVVRARPMAQKWAVARPGMAPKPLSLLLAQLAGGLSAAALIMMLVMYLVYTAGR